MAAPIVALAPFAKGAVDRVTALARERVIGWETVDVKQKKNGVRTTRSSVEIQAWELVLAAAVGAAAWWIVLWKEDAERTKDKPHWAWFGPPWTWPFTRPWEP